MQAVLVSPPVQAVWLRRSIKRRVKPVLLPELKPAENKLSRLLKLSQPCSVYGSGTAAEIDNFIHSLRD